MICGSGPGLKTRISISTLFRWAGRKFPAKAQNALSERSSGASGHRRRCAMQCAGVDRKPLPKMDWMPYASLAIPQREAPTTESNEPAKSILWLT